MARKKGSGCGTVVAVATIAILWYASKHPESSMTDAAPTIVMLALVAGLISIFAKPSKCSICGQQTGRKTGWVTVGGKRKKACANCVRNVQAKVSRDAVRRMGI